MLYNHSNTTRADGGKRPPINPQKDNCYERQARPYSRLYREPWPCFGPTGSAPLVLQPANRPVNYCTGPKSVPNLCHSCATFGGGPQKPCQDEVRGQNRPNRTISRFFKNRPPLYQRLTTTPRAVVRFYRISAACSRRGNESHFEE